jgi:hypothetical protein
MSDFHNDDVPSGTPSLKAVLIALAGFDALLPFWLFIQPLGSEACGVRGGNDGAKFRVQGRSPAPVGAVPPSSDVFRTPPQMAGFYFRKRLQGTVKR